MRREKRNLPEWRGGAFSQKGDLVIIAAYAEMEREEAARHRPQLVMVNAHNEIESVHHDYAGFPK